MLTHSIARFTLIAGVTAFFLSGCFGDSSSSSGPGLEGTPPDVGLISLSSAPDQVSGNTVLIGFEGEPATIAAETNNVKFWLNDAEISPTIREGRNGPEILVAGLSEGENRLELHHVEYGPLSDLTLEVYPVTGPIFSGPHQYPFVCSVTKELGKQPLVDTVENKGFPVLDTGGNQIGLSKDCSVEPYVEFVYRTTSNTWAPLPGDGTRPEDLATTQLSDGRVVDFIVRQERGTINRFIYSFATLAQLGDEPDDTSAANWNGRLLFHFQGGVAIGHTQGSVSNSRALHPETLGKGYAVIYSTGTKTDTHYNLQVGGETALMVKEHFIKRFGMPEYTVAIGGSGGGIQQYVYSQNHPDLLDAGMPQYSYPDMVTQTIHIGDCELLEHYMDVTDGANPKWKTTKNRSWLVGLNATNDYTDPLAELISMAGETAALGVTECVPAWRGLTPMVMNPLWNDVGDDYQELQDLMQPEGVMDGVQWTHYDDLRNIYGLDEDGNPRTLYDNVGVQYGLKALTDGNISTEEFLKLNAMVGGWKKPADMVQEGFPFTGEVEDVIANPATFDRWSSRNMTLSVDGILPAPRATGSLPAIQAAYDTGMVFDGELNMPVIDWRHYLEEVLDMHNSHQSFSVRQRITNKMGDAGNQIIWFTDTRPADTSNPKKPKPDKSSDPTGEALEVLHDWLMNMRANPEQSIADNKPAEAVDACYNTDGTVIAAGEGVWNGILGNQPDGDCTEAFKTYTTSRMVAGGPIEGSVFKCSLKPIATALTDGTYATTTFTTEETARLNEIFPGGVCDYNRPDQGRPEGL